MLDYAKLGLKIDLEILSGSEKFRRIQDQLGDNNEL